MLFIFGSILLIVGSVVVLTSLQLLLKSTSDKSKCNGSGKYTYASFINRFGYASLLMLGILMFGFVLSLT